MGLSAAIPMYLWQSNIGIAAAAFVIPGYTAWLWTHSHNQSVMRGVFTSELRALSLNSASRRIVRMLCDPGFWWNILFGGTIVCASVWYAGLHDPLATSGVAAAWVMIAISLRFGLTLVRPSTHCRRCAYDLTVQIAASAESNAVIACPECNAKWSRAQLGVVTPTVVDWRRRAA